MTRNRSILQLTASILCLVANPCQADTAHGPKNATVLIIRHAEKPDAGDGLTPAGEARAKAYIDYFRTFKWHSAPVKLDAIFAAADSKNSRRPRLTVEPTSQALGLAINTTYRDKEFQRLAEDLAVHYGGKNVLICWHHGEMPELIEAMGADLNALLPGGHWPGDEYHWTIVLRYDDEGRLKEAQRLEQSF